MWRVGKYIFLDDEAVVQLTGLRPSVGIWLCRAGLRLAQVRAFFAKEQEPKEKQP